MNEQCELMSSFLSFPVSQPARRTQTVSYERARREHSASIDCFIREQTAPAAAAQSSRRRDGCMASDPVMWQGDRGTVKVLWPGWTTVGETNEFNWNRTKSATLFKARLLRSLARYVSRRLAMMGGRSLASNAGCRQTDVDRPRPPRAPNVLFSPERARYRLQGSFTMNRKLHNVQSEGIEQKDSLHYTGKMTIPSGKPPARQIYHA